MVTNAAQKQWICVERDKKLIIDIFTKNMRNQTFMYPFMTRKFMFCTNVKTYTDIWIPANPELMSPFTKHANFSIPSSLSCCDLKSVLK